MRGDGRTAGIGTGREGEDADILVHFLDQIFGILDVAFCLEGLDDLVFEGGGFR